MVGVDGDAEGGVGAGNAVADQFWDDRGGMVQEEVGEGGELAVDGSLEMEGGK